MICLCSKSLKFFRTSKNGLKSDYFAKIVMYFAKFLNAFVKPRNSRKKIYIWNLQITRFKMIYDIFVFYEFEIFSNFQKWPKIRLLRENCNVFREILKCFRETAKFEFFAKKNIYSESPDHPLQNDMWYIWVLRVWNFFELPKIRLLRENCS